MKKRIVSLLTAVVCLASTLPQLAMAEPLEEPNATGNYGITLASVPIIDTNISSVAGTWSWTDPTIRPNVGTTEYEATFTPNDTDNYNSVTVMIPVTTLPAVPQITVNPTSTELVYGDKLEKATLSSAIALGINGEQLTGICSWSDTTTVPEAGTHDYSAIFTPDNSNYAVATVNVAVTVKAYTPDMTTVTPPVASNITYGQALHDSVLTGGSVSNIEGTWAWTDGNVAPNAGTAEYEIVFTPADTTRYNPINLNVTITIDKATPTLSEADKPTATSITYGQSLGDSVLSVPVQ